MRRTLMAFLLPASLLIAAPVAHADEAAGGAAPAPIVAPLGKGARPMPPGTPPSPAEHFTGEAGHPLMVWDVTQASLHAFLPAGQGTGRRAVIVLPGGGGRILGYDRSAQLARALQAQGVAGLVLKYRTQPLNLTADQLNAQMAADPKVPPAPIGQKRLRFEDIQAEVTAPNPYRDMQRADVVQAVQFLRTHAAQWGIDPDRIIIAGQSNGSILVSEYLTHEVQTLPLFGAALLYGAPPQGAPPSKVPVYLAAANDDVLTIDATIAMFQKWKAAGMPAELHAYQAGGHGFRKPDTSGNASWIADFVNWIKTLPGKP